MFRSENCPKAGILSGLRLIFIQRINQLGNKVKGYSFSLNGYNKMTSKNKTEVCS